VDRGHISDGLVCSDGLFLRIVVGWGFVVETVTELVLGLTDGPTSVTRPSIHSPNYLCCNSKACVASSGTYRWEVG
jgi:hypothetical protein